MKKTIVIGASTNTERYSNKAIHRLKSQHHEVVAVGQKPGEVSGVNIETKLPEYIEGLDTITLYINPERQKLIYNELLQLKPKRIIFNPGTENDELVQLANDEGIETVEACSLVMLAMGNY